MTPITGRPIRLGVLISGGGTTLTNFLAQIDQQRLDAQVPLVIASRADCGGIAKAKAAGIACHVISPREYADRRSFSEATFELCRAANVDLVTLAGYLCHLEVPGDFEGRVMNIHPALIPAFCGRGMYGEKVHAAVLERGCKVSGCTVHFADNEYDHGPIILQRCVPVLDDDDPHTLAARVFEAECEAYPEAIRQFAGGSLQVNGRRVRSSDQSESRD